VIPQSRDWRLLFAAFVVSTAGSELTKIALFARAYEIDANLTGVAFVALAQALPPLLMSPLAGGLADRYPKRPLLVAVNLIAAPVVLLLAFASTGPMLLGLAALLAGLTSAFLPIELAWEPQLVAAEGQLLQASSLRTAAGDLLAVLGPVAAGLLVAFGGTRTAFLVDAVTYVAATLVLLLISTTGRPAAVAEDAGVDSTVRRFAAIRFTWRNPQLRAIFVGFAAVVLVVNMQGPVLFTYVRQELHGSSAAFGLLIGALGAGSVAGSLLLARLPKLVARVGVLLVVVVLPFDALALIVLATVQITAVGIVSALVMGLLSAVFGTLVRYGIQVAADDRNRGRVFGLLYAIKGPLSAMSLAALAFVPATVLPSQILVASAFSELLAAGVAYSAYATARRALTTASDGQTEPATQNADGTQTARGDR
jgi:Na+/melibiose symporter-like transporter